MSVDPQYVAYDADIAPIAALIADPTRAAILTALLDGRPLAAGELARLAGVSAATASAHLARLLDGRMVAVTRQGRHRYYRLAGPEIAAVLEALARVSRRPPVRSLRQSRQAAALQDARTCYDHLAGRAGVALFAALIDRKIIKPIPNGCAEPARGPVLPGGGLRGAKGHHLAGARRPGDGRAQNVPVRPGRDDTRALGGESTAATSADAFNCEYEVTSSGAETLAAFGINLVEVRCSRRRFAGACLDWTQRRPHLNGALGAAITARLLERGWFDRGAARRALRLTEEGREGLAEAFGCVIES